MGRPVETAPETFFGSPESSPIRASVDAFTALVEYDVGDNARLSNRTRIADYDRFYQNVFPSSVSRAADGSLQVALAAYNSSMKRGNIFNQTDLVFAFDTGPVAHTLLAGAEFGRQQTDNLRLSGAFPSNSCNGRQTTANFCVPLSNPHYGGPVTFAPSATDADNRSVAKVGALYLQDQIEFSPDWLAIVGLRYDRFEVDLRNNRNGTALSSVDNLWSPRLGLVWKPIAPLSLYASYSTATLPRAGEQLSSLSATQAALDPEEFRNYEVGAKWDASPALSLTAAVYRLDRENVFTVDPIDTGRAFLIDGQRSEGFELSLAGEISRRWKLMAAYAYQDGEILSDIRTSATSVTPAGTRLAQLPRHSASVWNRFDFSDAWGAGLGVTYRDDIHASTSNAVSLDGYTRVDAALYYAASDAVKLQLNVENLFDTAYFANAHSDNNLMPGSPRAAYLSVHFSF
jgi:catecholate siderophore receptor